MILGGIGMKYKTKKKDLLLDILRKNTNESAITITEFLRLIEEDGINISRATIYRQFKLLEEDESVRVFFGNDGEKRYEYVEKDACKTHLHMVCRSCNKVFHIKSIVSQHFISQIEDEDDFMVDRNLSVIYGLCRYCRNS